MKVLTFATLWQSRRQTPPIRLSDNRINRKVALFFTKRENLSLTYFVMFCWVGYFKGCLHWVGDLSWILSMVADCVDSFWTSNTWASWGFPLWVCTEPNCTMLWKHGVSNKLGLKFWSGPFLIGAVHKVVVILFPVQRWSHFASTILRSFQSCFNIPTHCPGNSQRMSSGLFRLFSPMCCPSDKNHRGAQEAYV